MHKIPPYRNFLVVRYIQRAPFSLLSRKRYQFYNIYKQSLQQTVVALFCQSDQRKSGIKRLNNFMVTRRLLWNRCYIVACLVAYVIL